MGAYHLSIIEKQKKMKKRKRKQNIKYYKLYLLQGTGRGKGQNWYDAANQRGKALSVEVNWGN